MAAHKNHRRYIEVLVLVVFAALGVLIALGRLPLPGPPAGIAEFLPGNGSAGSPAEDGVLLCDQCPLDCPLAGTTQDDSASQPTEPVPIDEEPVITEDTADAVANLEDFPVPGGHVLRSGEELSNGGERVWIELVTCTPPEEVLAWYREHAPAAGWEPEQDTSSLVPNAVFLVYERAGTVVNVLVHMQEGEATRVVVDYPG